MPKMDFGLSRPLMNAAGTLGFAPDGRSGVKFSRFGAFITNPVSAGPRSPTQGERITSTPAGVLVHTGHPNPGFHAVLRQYARLWAHASLPVIVHLLGQHPDDLAGMVRRLEGMDGVMGIELGLPPGVDPAAARMMIEAAVGEMLLIVRLPESEEAPRLAALAAECGAGAVSLGAPRSLYRKNFSAESSTSSPSASLLEGRLYGPAVLPTALYRVRELAQQVTLPVIGSGGIYSEDDVQTMLAAGASAVQVDTALWRRMPWLFSD